ncbi:NAD(P)H-hydrate dehydratase [Simiduia curdlanivorans]|uniref:Bifunctional NAD(P)H-hydrate repair enzyme n=1 Tax=Simiduia curdlanivorans TaxID=1492769 RepID=A0ABV8V3M5_9GAMM|nr:NAD(P)H-hydrate dehydratase [Simiduia curdlanivorans]MDN3637279.1 NAD(P)H-hydrate dehydratase [Simiduia curdlanivorans]
MSAKVHSTLPSALYSAQSVRQLDQYLIQEQGIPATVLMKRAGRFAFEQLLRQWPEAKRLVVLCGGGNNGGDGYIVAALAQAKNFEVTLRWLSDPATLTGAAAQAFQFAQQEGVTMSAFDEQEQLAADVIVDGLLGTGLNAEVRGQMATAIAWINAQPAQVLALDLPSGICADTGAVMGQAVSANVTATFVGLKFGLFTGAGRACAGAVCFSDLQGDLSDCQLATKARRLDYESLIAALPARGLDTHKHSFGHLAVVGGDEGMAGAALIAAQAGLRASAGMVSLISRPLTAQLALSRQPELMALGVDAGIEAQEKCRQATAFVVGPGLGQGAWGEQLLAQVLACAQPTCIDADGLNLLAKQASYGLPNNSVITPHPGEAARLLGLSSAQVQADRAAAALALVAKTDAVVVLKGAGSLVAFSDSEGPRLYLVDAGNPGMASAGMGDLLAGIIGALLAQGLSAPQAAMLGAQVHAMAGDQMAEADGQRGLLATDLLPAVRWLLNGL